MTQYDYNYRQQGNPNAAQGTPQPQPPAAVQPVAGQQANAMQALGSVSGTAQQQGGQQQGTPYAQTGAITPQNTTQYQSIMPRATAQEQQLQGYQMQLAGQAANTPQYNYSGVGQAQTQQGLGAVGQALGSVNGMQGYAGYAPITNGRTDSYTQQAQGMLGGLGQGFGGVQGASADAQALRQALMSKVGGLDGPDRAALARSNFDLIQQAYEPQFQQDLRNVGKKAAALGRIGAGMTTSDLGDVAQRKNEYFGRAAQQLSNDAAALTLQDRLASLGGVQGALGQLEGADQSWAGLGLQGQGLALQGQNLARGAANDLFGMGQSLRNEEMANRQFDFTKDQANNQLAATRAGMLGSLGQQAFNMGQGMRGEQFGYDQSRYNAGLQGLGAVAGLGQQMYNQNAGLRDEMRGERAYQGMLNQQAQNDMIQQLLLEQQMQGTQFGQNLSAMNALGNLGYSQNPMGYMQQQANNAQQSADQQFGGAADLLGQYFAGQVGGGSPYLSGYAATMPNVTPQVTGGGLGAPLSGGFPPPPTIFPTR